MDRAAVREEETRLAIAQRERVKRVARRDRADGGVDELVPVRACECQRGTDGAGGGRLRLGLGLRLGLWLRLRLGQMAPAPGSRLFCFSQGIMVGQTAARVENAHQSVWFGLKAFHGARSRSTALRGGGMTIEAWPWAVASVASPAAARNIIVSVAVAP